MVVVVNDRAFKFSADLCFILARRVRTITFGDLKLQDPGRVADQFNDFVVTAL